MDIVTNLLVLVHLIGMACIVGGWISLRARRVESGGAAVIDEVKKQVACQLLAERVAFERPREGIE